MTPAGWYPDPSGAPGQRYFDGTQWTEHFNPQVPLNQTSISGKQVAQRSLCQNKMSSGRSASVFG
ncbi:DUF2510 domain-containing protein [Gordonia jinhuaensis]|uniref:DUF2510 domain-containing protein n=1 Tax=Gordonia jinhuaensis TaxID=1517702 RepID=UPI001E3DB6D0|nr:DUF2510 domain-containing protein [Gordonia jinhuaensis]